MDARLILNDGTSVHWDEVAQSEDAVQLHQWHADAVSIQDYIKSQIEASTHSGTADPAWLRKATGKVAICRTFCRLIDRRLASLGLPLPPDVGRWERRLIDRLRGELREANRKIAALELALAGKERAA